MASSENAECLKNRNVGDTTLLIDALARVSDINGAKRWAV